MEPEVQKLIAAVEIVMSPIVSHQERMLAHKVSRDLNLVLNLNYYEYFVPSFFLSIPI